jgi:hypothetical protein
MTTAVEAVQEEVMVEDRAFPMGTLLIHLSSLFAHMNARRILTNCYIEEAEVVTKVVDRTEVQLEEVADTKVVPEATEVDKEVDMEVDMVEAREEVTVVLPVASVEALAETACPTWARVSRHKRGVSELLTTP